jgi:hypothetical protein
MPIYAPDVPAALVAAFKEELAAELATPEAPEMIAKLGGEPRCLERFLIARQLKIPDAALMFRNTLAFRRDEVVPQSPLEIGTRQLVQPFWPGMYCGRTARGFPVQYMHFGGLEPKRMLQEVPEDRFRAFYIHWMELSMEHQNVSNPPHTPSRDFRGMVQIYDLKGCSMSQLHWGGLQMISRVIKLGQEHYPENLSRAVVTHAPRFFTMVWKVISSVLHENTRAKITVVADDGAKALREVTGLDREQLAQMFEAAKRANDPEGNRYLGEAATGEPEPEPVPIGGVAHADGTPPRTPPRADEPVRIPSLVAQRGESLKVPTELGSFLFEWESQPMAEAPPSSPRRKEHVLLNMPSAIKRRSAAFETRPVVVHVPAGAKAGETLDVHTEELGVYQLRLTPAGAAANGGAIEAELPVPVGCNVPSLRVRWTRISLSERFRRDLISQLGAPPRAVGTPCATPASSGVAHAGDGRSALGIATAGAAGAAGATAYHCGAPSAGSEEEEGGGDFFESLIMALQSCCFNDDQGSFEHGGASGHRGQTGGGLVF